MKTYSVKEVREITGLTWKQLYELKEGIPGIGPMNDAGYKQYSEEDLGKLVQATLMAKLGAKPKEINKAFADENYDRNKILKELQFRAVRQYVEAEDIITVTAALRNSSNDGEMLMNPAIRYLHIYAEHLRYVQANEDKDVLSYNDYIEKNGDDEIDAALLKLKVLDVADVGTEKASSLIRGLKEFAEKTIGMDGNRFLRLISLSLDSGNYDKAEFEKLCGKGKADTISAAIEIYMFMESIKESFDARVELREYIGVDTYDDEDIKTCVDSIQRSFMKNFGLKTTFEFLCKMESIKLLSIVTDYFSNNEIREMKKMREMKEELDYVIRAVRSYEEPAVS